MHEPSKNATLTDQRRIPRNRLANTHSTCSHPTWTLFASHHQHLVLTSTRLTMSSSRQRSTRRPRASKLALTMTAFFLSTLSASALHQQRRDGWRPDTELPGAKFILGDGKNEGSKAIGYEGEWPLWSSFRQKQDVSAPAASMDPTAPASSASSDSTTHVCASAGECTPCPEEVTHLPYCRPYNNRRRVACSPVTNRNDPASVQAALRSASAASNTTTHPDGVQMGYEACGKSAKQEARDYFEMIAVVASVAIFSVWAFVQRQKLLFQRQNQQLNARVSGGGMLRRRSSGAPTVASAATVQGNRKRSARLATLSRP